MTDENKTQKAAAVADPGDNGDNIELNKDPLPADISELPPELLAKLKQAAIKALASDGQEKALREMTAAVEKIILQTNQISAAVKGLAQRLLTDETREIIRDLRENLQPTIDLLDEMQTLEPHLRAELNKPEYAGHTFDYFIDNYTMGDLLEFARDPASEFARAMAAARAARSIIQSQQAGREQRKAAKEAAEQSNAIMELKGGNYPLFSKNDLWDAFAPGRICKMGTLDARYIDDKTGEILKSSFSDGELVTLDADEISFQAFMLLNSITANSVENVRDEFVKSGQITFYVKGVLQAFTDDPRTLLNNQLNIERKTAGVLYLENLFKPLQEYIGTTSNGSRYSVFNYVGYDAETDTMTIQTPYIYQLWRSTQKSYFDRKKRIEQAHQDNKKPKKADLKPLEINTLFKQRAYTENEITLEIAVYITNILLTAGKSTNAKTTEIFYKTIINNCPKLKQRLDDISMRPNTETLEDGKKRNNTAIYNGELRKIKNAFALIQNPDKCDALTMFEFIDIQPATKNKKGIFELNAPTKSVINEKIIIKWRSKSTETDE